MSTVTINVASLSDALNDFSAAWKRGQAEAPRISFESDEALWKTLTYKRWELLKAMTGAGAMSIREVLNAMSKPYMATFRQRQGHLSI